MKMYRCVTKTNEKYYDLITMHLGDRSIHLYRDGNRSSEDAIDTEVVAQWPVLDLDAVKKQRLSLLAVLTQAFEQEELNSADEKEVKTMQAEFSRLSFLQ